MIPAPFLTCRGIAVDCGGVAIDFFFFSPVKDYIMIVEPKLFI